MLERTISIVGIAVPRLVYGTAWKEDATGRLVELALEQGFRGIDTANQRRHYHEAAVGEALRAAIDSGRVSRDELFLQTKFTFRPGQDHRLPYDPEAPVAQQVAQSLASSLEHLGVEVIDSYLLHGPSQRSGLGEDDWAAWQAMEAAYDSGQVRLLGISNVNLGQLQDLCQKARIRPRFVQNRCYASLGWDRPVREFCAANNIAYQGFSLLTANRDVLSHREVSQLAQRYNRTASQIVFRFALEVDMVALTGTSSSDHMREDLDVFDFALQPDEVRGMEMLVAK